METSLYLHAVDNGSNGESERVIKHYSSDHTILLVGEGDFSFAACLARSFGSAVNMIATSLDTEEELKVKHPNAMDNVKELKERGCTVIHGVDACGMFNHDDLFLKSSDRIVDDNGTNGESERVIKHYSSGQRILLVGEGDFSFAACLARSFGSAANMIATSLDTEEVLMVKHPNAMDNVKELKERGCTVIHGVDACDMYNHPELFLKSFDRIVFNFPHAGFIMKEHSQSQIDLHKKLVKGFFRNAMLMVAVNGEVHVTHKTAYPFCNWIIDKLADEEGLGLVEKAPFFLWDYPAYENKRGDGLLSNQTFPVGECTTFKFTKSLG